MTIDGKSNRISILYEEREEREYAVPAAARVRVEPGEYIRAGQQLTDGPLDPQDILRIQGPEAVQLYLVEEVQKVYRNQGVNINDKHIEVIVRQMMRKVIIDSPGDTTMLPGEYIDRFEYEEANAQGLRRGRRARNGGAGAPRRDQGVAEHEQLPRRRLLPGDDARADRGRDLRQDGPPDGPEGERDHRQADPGPRAHRPAAAAASRRLRAPRHLLEGEEGIEGEDFETLELDPEEIDLELEVDVEDEDEEDAEIKEPDLAALAAEEDSD